MTKCTHRRTPSCWRKFSAPHYQQRYQTSQEARATEVSPLPRPANGLTTQANTWSPRRMTFWQSRTDPCEFGPYILRWAMRERGASSSLLWEYHQAPHPVDPQFMGPVKRRTQQDINLGWQMEHTNLNSQGHKRAVQKLQNELATMIERHF